MRARAAVLAIAALVALGGILLLTRGSDSPDTQAPEDAAAERAFSGAPPPLRALYEQRNQLLGGGQKAFDARIAELRGYPVVVNKWASWCGPCRAEFPVFQKAALQEAKRIAFLGVDANDFEGDAREFLAEVPIPYPSYVDPESELSRQLKAPVAFPATAFFDKRGELVYTHQGPYRSVDELLSDVRRYAGGGA